MTSNLIPSAKRLYVGSVRLVEPVARRAGLLNWLESASSAHRWAHWSKSLFAIHDIDALVELDVPWWTYKAIDEVATFLENTPEARVFEFGSGASTVWLARRAANVTSVEHNSSWHALVKSRLAELGLANSPSLRLVEPVSAVAGTDPRYLSQKPGHSRLSFEIYATSILKEQGSFDLVVVDGRARGACLEHALTKLSPGGVIVFDNSARARYREAIAMHNLEATRYRGLTPSLPYFEETTLLKVPTDLRQDTTP